MLVEGFGNNAISQSKIFLDTNSLRMDVDDDEHLG